jgi:hypothetical protein
MAAHSLLQGARYVDVLGFAPVSHRSWKQGDAYSKERSKERDSLLR